ncbi:MULTISPECIES: metal-sensitive transcriptional regulator [unclassified Breznakia]|uniref:metal-sensitive transcriptional regulator n=1 Tax=unclassified Breznakia TaxID=2623764 RepID=UPI0024757071|nr:MULTISPECIES: metal-sensitive transcriptional regulator [unclassified Breznakia]MDH6367837.1 DNA-binding FrmR family transcriptional regulator [Breznakia sp. PH1-1]MDH6404916.1 DNA-binding FrmR family transcriptional regulator [Breznakia sp. PF1-11]MDH6412640.1 DNA-binding FrmR family transcriptional regulator [Breznakia sp. PFB1-11]MDH6414991.1 DNA-binding FrmR family transcriptional regulator [Breznakia sp. PFB1-14]MDH6417302.1 DNA-binding FrmR family transcriptional regulator [Breznakia 
MKCDAKIVNRIKRSEGQLHGILKMLEEEKDCKDIVNQLSAVRSSVDRIIALIVVNNLKQLSDTSASESAIEEAVELLMKSR